MPFCQIFKSLKLLIPPPIPRSSFLIPDLVLKMPLAGKGHGHAAPVAGIDHVLIFNGTAGLDNGANSEFMGHFNIVRLWEKSIAGQNRPAGSFACFHAGNFNAVYTRHLSAADSNG